MTRKRAEKKRRLARIILGITILIAILAAAVLVYEATRGFSASAPATSKGTNNSESPEILMPTSSASPSVLENPTPDPSSSNRPNDDNPSKPINGGANPTKPSSGGSDANNTKPVTPKPVNCPNTKTEDPKLWDACRAGYVAPTIEFAGLVSCTARDSTKENWDLRYAFTLSGGNYAEYGWYNSGGSKHKVLIKGYPLEGPSDTYPLIARAEVAIYPMNGLNGVIDVLEFSESIMVPIGQFCH